MRVARLIGSFGWIVWMATGCASGPTYVPATYVVQPRDTVYSIAWRHDLDYRELARWNRLGPDYRIEVGQVLTLEPRSLSNLVAPGSAAPLNTTPRPASGTGQAALARQAAVPGPGAPESVEPAPARPGQPCGPAEEHWTWPTAHVTAPRPVPGGGVLLLGTLGQPIRAACAGRIVYAGSGIRGYGNLIIIKHGDTVLSAYAHTMDLTVHEGQEVSLGEEIAHMGTGTHDIPALYFEIRLNGRPVDPLPFLPAGE